MNTPKSTKQSKIQSAWITCDQCHTTILHKESENHKSDCPPNPSKQSYPYIKNNKLYGSIDLKDNEDLKGLTQHEKDCMVFLSQSAIQLCNLNIGMSVIITPLSDTSYPIARTVWPTTEKNSASVLFTKTGLELSYISAGVRVCVSSAPAAIKEARKIYLVSLNAPKSLDLTSEVTNRIHRSYLAKLLASGNRVGIRYFGKLLLFQIKQIEPLIKEELEVHLQELSLDNPQAEFFQVTEKTEWILFRDESAYKTQILSTNSITKIAGLNDEICEVKALMEAALGKTPVIPGFKLGCSVLLYGSSGTGKTMMARALPKELHVTEVCISPTEVYSKSSISPEEAIKNLFQEAIDRSPCVIVMDEIDVLCPSRNSRLTDTEKRVVSTTLSSLDNIFSLRECKIFVIATTNKLESVDSSFRRCGRFDREIEIPVPNPKARYEIIKGILEIVPTSVSDSDIKEIAYKTHGFVGADLVSLCSCAVLNASRRSVTQLTVEDLQFSVTRIRPSAMREVQIEVPNVRWTDIGGQQHLKLILCQAVEWPLKHPESFLRLGITPPRGVLMFGPPGCSKTMIAKALATESGLNFLSIKGPELFSKWVGESERAVREVFRKARQVAPSVIFFDEIDALGGERSSGTSTSVQERVLAQLLTELDGVTPLGDVTVLAATNRPDRIDKALLRPGRLDRIVYVPLPDAETRKDIFRIKLSKMPVKDVDFDTLVQMTEGYSGAEINAVCHEAAMKALEEDLQADSVTHRHFLEALKLVTPRTNAELLNMYSEFVNR